MLQSHILYTRAIVSDSTGVTAHFNQQISLETYAKCQLLATSVLVQWTWMRSGWTFWPIASKSCPSTRAQDQDPGNVINKRCKAWSSLQLQYINFRVVNSDWRNIPKFRYLYKSQHYFTVFATFKLQYYWYVKVYSRANCETYLIVLVWRSN